MHVYFINTSSIVIHSASAFIISQQGHDTNARFLTICKMAPPGWGTWNRYIR